jgi:hypothetical protein
MKEIPVELTGLVPISALGYGSAMRSNLRITASFALLCAIAAGCGSGGGTANDGAVSGDGAGPLGGGVMTWKEGGTPHTAQFATAAFAHSASLDLLNVVGSEPNLGLAFGIGAKPPPLVTGQYACGGTGYPIVSLTYTGTEGQMFTCAIDLTALGATAGSHAVGTFSATLGVAGGGSKVITEGRFDVPMTVSTL